MSAPKEEKARRPRRWRKWLVRLAVLLVLLALALRVAIPPLAPVVLRAVGRSFRLEVELADLSLDVTGGRGAIRGLVVRPARAEGAAPAEPLLRLDYADLELDLRALLGGRLRIARMEADGLSARVLRRADGTFELADHLPAGGDENAEPEPEPAEPAPLDLTLPLEIGALRAQGVSLVYRDEGFEEPIELRLEASARITDLGSGERPAQVELFARSPGLLGLARLAGRIESPGASHSARLTTELARLRPGAVAPLLAALGLRPCAEELSGSLRIELDAGPREEGADELRAELALLDLEWREDERETARLDELRVAVEPLSARGLGVALAEVRGGRLATHIAADGPPGVLGLELAWPERLGGGGGEQTPAPAPVPATTSSTFVFAGVERLALLGLELSLEDRSRPGTGPQVLALERLELERLRLAPGSPPSELRLEAAAPGLYESLRVHGPIALAGPERSVELALELAGLRPTRLEPWLASLGIESTFESGTAEGRLAARWTTGDEGGQGSLSLEGLRLADGVELLALERLALDELAWGPEGGLRLGRVEVRGPHVKVLREVEDTWRVAGLRLGLAPPAAEGPPAAPEVAPEEPAPPSGQAGAPPPEAPPVLAELEAMLADLAVELGSLTWGGARLELVDEDPERPLDLVITDAGLEVSGLVLGAGSGGLAPPPARLRAHFSAQGLAEALTLEGSVRPDPGRSLAADLRVDGRGLSLAGVEPLVRDLGLRPELQAAELRLNLATGLRLEDGRLGGELELGELRFTDQGRELVACDRFALRGMSLTDGRLRLEEIAIEAPRAQLARDAEGALGAAGLVLAPPQRPAEPAPPGPGVEASPLGALAELLQAELALPAIGVGRVAVSDAALGWSDAALDPPAELRLGARLELTDLELGSAKQAAFEAALSIEGGPEELAVRGELSTDPQDLSVTGRVEGRGLRAGPLAAYLPAGLALELADGRLALDFDVGYGAAEEGGRSLRAIASALELAEGETTLARFERAAAVAARLDPEELVFELGELSLKGLELDVRRTERGIEALGLVLAPPDEASAPPPMPAGDEPPVVRPVPWWARLRVEGPKLPDARIESLDVGLARLTFVDETRPEAEPLELSARAFVPGPQVLYGADPEALPPLELRFESEAAPLLGRVETSLRIAPFAREPDLALELVVGGIRGDGLTALAPELAATIDGGELTEGELRARVSGELRWSRRGPTDFDLTRGFGGELDVEELAFRRAPGGELLAGLESIDVQLLAFRPLTGALHVHSIDVEQPYLRVLRDAEGIHVLGLTLKPAETSDAEPPAEEIDEPEEQLAATEPAPSEPSPEERAPPAAELRVDRFRVSGLDFELRDTTVDPPFVYPLIDLDLTVDGLSTRVLSEERSIVFGAELVGGSVLMPEHYPQAGLLGGVLGMAGAMAGAVVGLGDDRPLEERPVFGSIYSSGRLSLHPRPEGWLSLRVNDFELLPFRQLGVDQGVELGDGLVDSRVQAQLEEGVLRVETRTVFRSLSVSEPIGGPISRFLKLPAPLDTVLWAVRNDAGEQVVPVSFEMKADEGLSTGKLVGAATGALASVLTDAVTSAPKRVLSSVTDLPLLAQVSGFLGKLPVLKWFFGEDAALEHAGRAFTLRFAPGATTVADFELARMRPMLAALQESDSIGLVLVHELGGGDLARAEALANPDPADCRELGERLRQRKAELLQRRSALSGELEALYAAGRVEEAAAPREELRVLDVELGETESALDGVYELLESSADRQRARRTREGALTIARQRLEVVRGVLLEEVGAEHAGRVEQRPPRFARPEGASGGSVTVRVVRLR